MDAFQHTINQWSVVNPISFRALGEISFILFTGLLNWEDLAVLFMLIPAVGMLLTATFFLTEDPVLLFTKLKFKECKESLHHIAMINRTD